MFRNEKYVMLDCAKRVWLTKKDVDELKAQGEKVTKEDMVSITTYWLDMENPSACAYWASYKPVGVTDCRTTYLEHYAFLKENAIDLENYEMEEGEVVFILSERLLKLPKVLDEEDHYSPEYKKFTSLEEAKTHLEKVSDSPRVMVFSIKNDILPKALAFQKARKEAYEKYRARKVHFKGDIVITDPCYILDRDDRYEEGLNKKNFFDFEEEKDYPDFDGTSSKLYQEQLAHYKKVLALYTKESFEVDEFYDDAYYLGFRHSTMESSTLYGDWSCHVFDKETNEPIGQFCADGGMVCVYHMDDVRRYNPTFEQDLDKHPWIATIIKDFDGYVQFEIEDDSLYVCGYGNKNFQSRQTGL